MKLQEPKYFYKKWGISTFLLPFSLIYKLGDKLNQLTTKTYKSKAKVICVGNIVLGGVGKTPVVIKLIELFLIKNIKVGGLSGGYGSQLSSDIPFLIDTKKHTGIDVGDEPYLIATKYKNVPVCVCKNRANGAKFLENKVDVIIMDDGFQNYKLAKDIKICVFDGVSGLSNGYIFPAGPLRQSLKSGLKGVNLAIIMRKSNPLLETTLKLNGVPVINGITAPTDSVKNFIGKEVIAFAGIGKPEKFYKTLTDNNINVVDKVSFPDHYAYTQSDIETLLNLSKLKGLPLLTTMKDYVKLPNDVRKKITPIDIEVKFDNEKILSEILF